MKILARILKIISIAVCLVFIGLIICPNSPGLGDVDPNQLLRAAKAAQNNSKNAIFQLPKDTSSFIISIQRKDTIAGRNAWALRLMPHAKRLPWSQYWIDDKTKAVVAFREWDGHNNLVRSGKL